MKIEPASTKKKLLYSVGVLCASLTSCDGNPFSNLVGRQSVPGSVPNDNPVAQPEKSPEGNSAAQPEEIPQILGGDVPYLPPLDDEPNKQAGQPEN